MPDTESGAPPRTVIAIAAALAVAFAVAVAVFGLIAGSGGDGTGTTASDGGGPLPLVPVPAPQAGTPPCTQLVGAAPGELTSSGAALPRRTLAEPAPRATVAWGGTAQAEPVVLRCGLNRPAELTRTAPLRVVNGVQWLVVPGPGSATWYAVDREVYVALTVPDAAGTGPLQRISDLIGATLPPVPLRFG